MIEFANPKKLSDLLDKIITPLCYIAPFLLFVALIWGGFFTDQDYLQGDFVKIIYVHVPSAFLMSLVYYLLCLFSILYLFFRIKTMWFFIESYANIGFMMTAITLITGALWGKPTWNAYWDWDPRIISVTIQLFIYLLLLILVNFSKNSFISKNIACYYCLLLSFNIPLIKFSVDIWSSLHQKASITLFSGNSINNVFFVPLVFSIIATFLFVILLSLMETNYKLKKNISVVKNAKSKMRKL